MPSGAAITGPTPCGQPGGGAPEPPLFGARFANMGAVRYSGDTVTVTLARPDSLFAYLLDIPVLKAGETGASSPTSSGRYSVGQDDRGAILTANPDFAGQTAVPTIRLVELSGYDALVSASTSARSAFFRPSRSPIWRAASSATPLTST